MERGEYSDMNQENKKRIDVGKKGAAFENDVARFAMDHLGIKLERNPYRQQKQANEPDLISEDHTWPWSIECKRYASAVSMAGWIAQAEAAANMYGKEPVVIYKLDRKPARAVFRASALIKAGGGTWDNKDYIEMDLSKWWEVARELWAMAVQDIPPSCYECNGTGTLEKITFRDYGRGPEPDAEDISCEHCGGTGKL